MACMSRAVSDRRGFPNSPFFAWAARTRERCECAASNPPFIRYQTFKGEVRRRALELCAGLGAKFSGLTASWAPFLVATASLLKLGGRMAFVVPASIGHAPYAAPLLDYLIEHFDVVRITAIRTKLFPELSECSTRVVSGGVRRSCVSPCSTTSSFKPTASPCETTWVPVPEWRGSWNRRLRPYLLPANMSGRAPSLVRNSAAATCTNAVHSVRVRHRKAVRRIIQDWDTPFVRLSCELEGHPLGGGMLKLEPREATKIVFPAPVMAAELSAAETKEAVSTMRKWRHYAVQ